MSKRRRKRNHGYLFFVKIFERRITHEGIGQKKLDGWMRTKEKSGQDDCRRTWKGLSVRELANIFTCGSFCNPAWDALFRPGARASITRNTANNTATIQRFTLARSYVSFCTKKKNLAIFFMNFYWTLKDKKLITLYSYQVRIVSYVLFQVQKFQWE